MLPWPAMENVDVAKERKGVRMNLGIEFFEDGCVDIIFNKYKFTLHLDERGWPAFSEALKETLPSYVPEMVEILMKSQGPVTIVVDHKPGCPEEEGTGKCNCDPHIPEESKYIGMMGDGKLTCQRCDKSSIGTGLYYWLVEDDSSDWERFSTGVDDTFYWVVAIPGAVRLMICHRCMNELGIEFPNAIPSFHDWWDTQRSLYGLNPKG
jgi:hypothetical protein